MNAITMAGILCGKRKRRVTEQTGKAQSDGAESAAMPAASFLARRCDSPSGPLPLSSGPASADAPSAEGCPPPMSWRQVLARFREESDRWVVKRDGYELCGRTWGQGPPLYLLSGIGGTCELFALVVWLLRDQFRCVVYDYPEEASTASGMADDLFAVADFHGEHRFTVYAASFGSVPALTAILHKPDRLSHAILQTGFAHRSLSAVERLLIRVGRRLPGRLAQVPLVRTFQKQNHLWWFPPFDRSRWEFFVENTGAVPIRALANRAAVLREFGVRCQLGQIKQPVLLLQSEGDGNVAERCHRELESGLPHARTETLVGCGHIPYLTHPHRIAKLIRSFLG